MKKTFCSIMLLILVACNKNRSNELTVKGRTFITGDVLYGDSAKMWQLISRDVKIYTQNATNQQWVMTEHQRSGRAVDRMYFANNGKYMCDSMIWSALNMPSEATFQTNGVLEFDSLIVVNRNTPFPVIAIQKGSVGGIFMQPTLKLRSRYFEPNTYDYRVAEVKLEQVK